MLTLTYQHLINEYWTSTNTKAETKSKLKPKPPKPPIKVSNKEDDFDTQFTITQSQTMSSTDNAAEQTAINIKELADNIGPAPHLIDHGSLIKTQEILSKPTSEQTTSVDPNTLTSIIVENDVSLADISNMHYHEITPTPMQTIPKYQQALQVSLNVQQTLQQDVTGKVVFPKHVFSQTQYSSKKSQQKQQDELAASQRVTCDICQKSLKTKKMLWAHKVAVHYGGNFPCDICGKKCITGAELRRHMTSHSTERKFACQYCGLAYKRWSHLYQHLRVHEEEKNFRCDVCHVNFKVQAELKDHCFAEHCGGELVQCSVCKHKLATPLAVYHHSMKHTGTRDFICQICGSNFKRKQHLVTHMKTHFTEKRGPNGTNEVYNCQACDEKFNLKMELKAHCSAAHPCNPSDEVVRCKTCDKKLNLTHSIYLHGLRHCGDREFKCNQCNQLFKRKAHLLRHQADRHPAEPRERKKRTTPAEALVCMLCKRSFKYKASLIKHMSQQHGIFPKEDGEIYIKKGIKKPHQCQYCQKRFRAKNNLAKHIANKHGNEDGAVDSGTNNLHHSNSDSAQEDDTDEIINGDVMEQVGIGESASTTENSETKQKINVSTEEEVTRVDNDVEKILSDSMAGIDETSAQETSDELQQQQQLQQIVTVDQQTGRIILLSPEDMMAGTSQVSKNDLKDTKDNDVQKSHDNNEASNITNQLNQPSEVVPTVSSSYDTQGIVQTIPTMASGSSLQQSAGGYLVNQDGVAVASLPLQTVQELSDSGSVLEFTHGTNNQIVVLLSALNSQNIGQL